MRYEQVDLAVDNGVGVRQPIDREDIAVLTIPKRNQSKQIREVLAQLSGRGVENVVFDFRRAFAADPVMAAQTAGYLLHDTRDYDMGSRYIGIDLANPQLVGVVVDNPDELTRRSASGPDEAVRNLNE